MTYRTDKDILDFEDIIDDDLGELVEFITPGTIERRVKDMNQAWQSLNSFSDNEFVKKEVLAWNTWAKTILDSWFARLSGVAVMKELDVWQARYNNAFTVANAHGHAPSPEVFNDLKENFNLTPILIGVGVGAGLLLLLKFLSR